MNLRLPHFLLATLTGLSMLSVGDAVRALDAPAAGLAQGVLPPPPPKALAALIGEYGVGEEFLTLYEAGGQLYANGHGLDRRVLRPHSRLEFTAAGNAPSQTTRFVFHRAAAGEIDAVAVDGSSLPRRDVGAEAIAAIRSGLRADPAALRASALTASTPLEPEPKKPADLVALAAIDPSIQFDIRYASTNNFMGFPLYERPGAFLQRPAAQALGRVAQALRASGYGLVIYDAYRPWFVTRMFWDATPPQDHLFVADPAQGSRHNRGCAVDLSLYDLRSGAPQETTSRYDEMSRRAYSDYVGGTSRQRWLRDLLRREMEKQGFTVYDSEWWHFDYAGWRDYAIGNLPFESLDAATRP